QRGAPGLTAAAGQVHVEQHDVGPGRGDPVDGRRHVFCLADDLHLVAKLGPDPGPEQAVVVHDEHPRPRLAGHAWLGVVAARGMDSDTSGPSPGALRTLATPPRRAIPGGPHSRLPALAAGT